MSDYKLVLASGVFDMLHAQHVMLLQWARAQGGRLVVAINSDASARRLKGPGRPVISQDDRHLLLMSLRCVNSVIIFEEDTPLETILRVRPDIYVKGHDYQYSVLPEAEALKEWGGRVWIAPTTGRESTSQIIERIALTERKACAAACENAGIFFDTDPMYAKVVMERVK